MLKIDDSVSLTYWSFITIQNFLSSEGQDAVSNANIAVVCPA